jgi:hypothetical protein
MPGQTNHWRDPFSGPSPSSTTMSSTKQSVVDIKTLEFVIEFTPTLQKPEGFRVKASEGEVVVFYFEPSATQDLNSSGFPEG